MTTQMRPTIALIPGLEEEVAAARKELVAKVARLDALKDLHLRAIGYRDRRGRDPSMEDLLREADEVERASLQSLIDRITGDSR